MQDYLHAFSAFFDIFHETFRFVFKICCFCHANLGSQGRENLRDISMRCDPALWNTFFLKHFVTVSVRLLLAIQRSFRTIVSSQSQHNSFGSRQLAREGENIIQPVLCVWLAGKHIKEIAEFYSFIRASVAELFTLNCVWNYVWHR